MFFELCLCVLCKDLAGVHVKSTEEKQNHKMAEFVENHQWQGSMLEEHMWQVDEEAESPEEATNHTASYDSINSASFDHQFEYYVHPECSSD